MQSQALIGAVAGYVSEFRGGGLITGGPIAEYPFFGSFQPGAGCWKARTPSHVRSIHRANFDASLSGLSATTAFQVNMGLLPPSNCY